MNYPCQSEEAFPERWHWEQKANRQQTGGSKSLLLPSVQLRPSDPCGRALPERAGKAEMWLAEPQTLALRSLVDLVLRHISLLAGTHRNKWKPAEYVQHYWQGNDTSSSYFLGFYFSWTVE